MCLYGFSSPAITAVSNALSTGTEWTVGEDLGSDHLPITTTITCEWNSFSAAVEEATELFLPAPRSLRSSVHRFNSVLLATTKLYVGKAKAGRYTKPWSTPELREAIKKRNALRRTISDNRDEYLEVRAATRKLQMRTKGAPGPDDIPLRSSKP